MLSIDCEMCIHFGAKLELLYWGELVGIHANGPSCRFTTNEWMYQVLHNKNQGVPERFLNFLGILCSQFF